MDKTKPHYTDTSFEPLVPGHFYINHPIPPKPDLRIFCQANSEGVPLDREGKGITCLVGYIPVSDPKSYAESLRQKSIELGKDADFLEKGLEQLASAEKPAPDRNEARDEDIPERHCPQGGAVRGME